jgi:maleylpyruvate isomerase
VTDESDPHPPLLPHLDETVAATRRFLATLDGLTDGDLREPSLLPGWTRGHVVAHVARNADAVSNLVTWAATGVERPMYPSQEARDAAIEDAAARPATEQRSDAATSAARFLAAARALPVDRWEVEVTRTPGGPPFPVRRVGAMRRTEVEVHHADLGTAYTAADWPEDFLDHLLGRRERELAAAGRALTLELTDRGTSVTTGAGGPRVSGSTADIVWWLLGRGTGERLACSDDRLPDLGRWV